MNLTRKDWFSIAALVGMSLLIGMVFLSFNMRGGWCRGLTSPHGEVAYNVYAHNSIKINPDRMREISLLQTEREHLVDYSEIDAGKYGRPTRYRSIQDTVGYGVLLGLLWKLTESFNYLDIQLLQILVLSLLVPFFYMTLMALFRDKYAAIFGSIALVLFLPLHYLNVQALRDIWVFYGTVILIWALSRNPHSASRGSLLLAAVFFTVCQWLRPTAFAALLAGCFVAAIWAFFVPMIRVHLFQTCALFLMINVLGFWLPFGLYNRAAYGRTFVMASGQGLLEGLGEFENPWGYELCDGWITEYIGQRYGESYGTPEFDDRAKKVFVQSLSERPGFYAWSVIRRLPQLLWPGLPFTSFTHSIPAAKSLKGKFIRIFKGATFSWKGLLDFLTRQILVRLFLLLGYLGFFLMFRHRHYLAPALFILVGVLPGWFCIQSHVEYRYLIPHYAFFATGVGYAISKMKRWL